MKKYFNVLLAVFFILCTDCWGMNKKDNFIYRPDEMILEKIKKELKITIRGYKTNSENKVLELDLSNNNIKDLNSLVELLIQLPILYFLDLRDCNLTVITPLKKLKKLKKLYLDGNNIKEVVGLENLTELSLKNNSTPIDFKGNRELYNKMDNFSYSVKQEIVRPEKKQKPEIKVQPKKLEATNLPFSLRVAPPKKNPLITQKELPTAVQKIEPTKQIEQKIRGEKRKNEESEEAMQKNKRRTLNPSETFIAKEKEDSSKKESPAETNTSTPQVEYEESNKEELLIPEKIAKNLRLPDANKKAKKINVVKQRTIQANSSYMSILNRYKNWIVGGLTVAAVGASTYLFNRLKKQKAID